MAAIKQWVDYDLTIYEPTSTPYYRITYVVDGERRQSSGGRTLKDAEKRVREIKQEVDGSPTASPASSDMTVGDLLKHYIEPAHHLGWGTRHAEEQERFVRLHVRPHLNLRKPAAGLTAADFERILSERMQRTDSLDTFKSAIQKCRTLVTHAQRHAGLTGDPMDGLGKKARQRFRQQQTVSEPTELDSGHIRVGGELDRIIPSFDMALAGAAAYAARRAPGDALSAEERELEILVHPYTGLRPGEGRALTAGQVEEDGASILVDRTLAEAKGKKWVKPPKNGKSRRVAVPPPLRPGLAARRACVLDASGPGGLMFPAPQGAHWSRSNFSRKFRPAKEAAGWLDTQTLRDLRHLYAVTALGDWGLPLEVVSGELGHHSPEFTSRRYLSRRQGYREAMEATFGAIDWEPD